MVNQTQVFGLMDIVKYIVIFTNLKLWAYHFHVNNRLTDPTQLKTEVLLIDSYHRSLKSNGALLYAKPRISASHLFLISLLQWHFQIMALTDGGPQALELIRWVGKQKQILQGKKCHKHFIESTEYIILKQMMCHLCDWCRLHPFLWNVPPHPVLTKCMFITHKYSLILRQTSWNPTDYSGV